MTHLKDNNVVFNIKDEAQLANIYLLKKFIKN